MRARRLLPILAVIALGATAASPVPVPTYRPRYIASLGLPVPTAPGSGVTKIAREDWGPAVPPIQAKLDATTLATIATAVERAGISQWFYDNSLPPSEIHEHFNGGGNNTDDDLPVPHPAPHNYSYELTVARRTPDGTIETGQGYWQAAGTTAEPQDALTLADIVANAFKLFSR